MAPILRNITLDTRIRKICRIYKNIEILEKMKKITKKKRESSVRKKKFFLKNFKKNKNEKSENK